MCPLGNYESEGLPQLDAMRDGVDYRRPINVRGFSVMMRPLTNAEENQVLSAVMAHLRTVPEAARTVALEHMTHAREMLKLGSSSDVGKYDYQITDPMLDRMTVGEIDFMFKQYVSICDMCNPSLEKISDDKLKELVEDIKKNSLLPTELSFLELANVCRFLIQGD